MGGGIPGIPIPGAAAGASGSGAAETEEAEEGEEEEGPALHAAASEGNVEVSRAVKSLCSCLLGGFLSRDAYDALSSYIDIVWE